MKKTILAKKIYRKMTFNNPITIPIIKKMICAPWDILSPSPRRKNSEKNNTAANPNISQFPRMAVNPISIKKICEFFASLARKEIILFRIMVIHFWRAVIKTLID